MKKIFLTILAFVCATSLMAEVVKLNGLYYSLGTTTATVMSDQSSDKSAYAGLTAVTVPASVTYNNYTYTVTTIGVSAFEGCANLQSVVLPSSVTAINTDAFYGCTRLASVNLEEGLSTIGLRAFFNCHLSSVTIPSTVTSIGNAAFKTNGTPSITSVTWLPATCSIGTDDSAPFYSTNSQITSFTFGPNVQTIPAYLCKYMSQLDTVVLPPSVTSLGNNAFMYCTGLQSINLPETLRTLPTGIFEGCTALESIHLPSSVTAINTDAFYGCTRLASVNLEEGLSTIGLRAFFNCHFSSVTIPSTVTSIGNAAFKTNGTPSIMSVTWLPATCSIGTDDSAPFYSTNSQITSFTFGPNVQTIPAYLCKYMSRLDTVVLSQNVTTIGIYAFNRCSGLEHIEIPASVSSIGAYAFAYNTGLKNLSFPQGLTTIASSVLEGCTALEDVVIPSSVTTINLDAFYNCSNLLAIHNYAYTPQTIVERTVNKVNKQTCILYVPMDYIDLYRAKSVWCDFVNIIGVATDLQFENQTVSLSYLRQDSSLFYMEAQTWAVPHEPRFEGFMFLGWQVQSGMLEDGIVLQAIYESNTPTPNPSDVIVNPANKAQKLIRKGNVYILQDDRIYTVQGQRVQ